MINRKTMKAFALLIDTLQQYIFVPDCITAPQAKLSGNNNPNITNSVGQFNSLKSISNAVEIYPNPFKDNITVKCSNIVYCKLTVFDETGRSILNGKFSQTNLTLDLTDFSNGVYFCRIHNELFEHHFIILKQ